MSSVETVYSQEPSAWIVASLKMKDGQPGEMAFNNPSVPDMTLEDCEKTLPEALPMIKEMVEKQVPATFLEAKCVWSAGDPIKPKN